jgi:hypothetical protein
MATDALSRVDGSTPVSSFPSVRGPLVTADAHAPRVASGYTVLGQHPKSALQECAQKHHYALPAYARDRRADRWHAIVTVNGRAYPGVHDHNTAKDAEADAATEALRLIHVAGIPAAVSAIVPVAPVVATMKQSASRRGSGRGIGRGGRARGNAVASKSQRGGRARDRIVVNRGHRRGRAGAGSPDDTSSDDPYTEGRELYKEWYGYYEGNTGYDPD